MLLLNKPKIFDVDVYGIGVLAVLAVGTFLGALRPLDDAIAQRNTDCDSALNQQQSSAGELKRLEEVAKQQKLLAERLSRTPDVLRGNPGMSEIVRRLGILADATGLVLNELTPGEVERSEYFSHTVLTLQLAGDFPHMQGFVKALQDKLPYVRVLSMTIENSPQGGGALCRAYIDLHVFFPR